MQLQPDPGSPIPLHLQAEQLLRQLIQKEAYQNGKVLPGEVALAAQWGIARNTLRKAIYKLVYEGLLIRKRRSGTSVAPNKPGTTLLRPFVSETCRGPGSALHPFEVHVYYSKPTAQAAAVFDTGAETGVLRLERLSGDPVAPFVYSVAEFNPKAPLSVSDNFNRPLCDLIEKEHRLPIVKVHEAISAASAGDLLASKFGLEPGAPVLVRKSILYTTDAFPVMIHTAHYRADSFIYSIEHLRS